jgi:hypothetical protein
MSSFVTQIHRLTIFDQMGIVGEKNMALPFAPDN